MSNLSSRLQQLPPADRRRLVARLVERRSATERTAPLSHAQQRLWFLEHLVGNNPYYNETSAIRLHFPVDHEALRTSLNHLVRRHQVLRTVFEVVEDEPRQRILRSLELDLSVVDLTTLDPNERDARVARMAEQQGRPPFDLTRAPLLRTSLVRCSPGEYVFILTMHHIVCDGWSMGIFFRELQAYYDAEVTGRPADLPALAMQYADFATLQREWLAGPTLDRQLAYWREQLTDIATLELPTDFPRPAVPEFRGAREAIRLSPDVYDALRNLSDQESATPFMALVSAFQTVLHRYSGQDDIAVGSPIANRNRPELEGLIGFFVNTLVIRSDLSGQPSFREVLRRVREVALSAYAHQDVPFERLVAELQPQRDPGRNPLFQVTFQLINAPTGTTGTAGTAGVTATTRSAAERAAPAATGSTESLGVELQTAKFDLRCDLWEEEDGGVCGYLEYSTELFRAERVRAMARHLEAIVLAATATPEAPISDLRMLTPDEERRIVKDWNDTEADLPGFSCVQEAFEACAARDAGALAVSDKTTALTYGELNGRANQLARHLIGRGVVPGSMVAVVMAPSVDYVTAIIAVLKAGGAYVPLAPSTPGERLRSIVQDGLLHVVLTTAEVAPRVPPYVETICADDAAPPWAHLDRSDLPRQVHSQSLAYVIFTSGSTGRPKGVELLHSGLTNLVGWHNSHYDVQPADRATLCANPGFDASVWEMWPYLTAGASLWIPDDGVLTAPEDLLRWWTDNGVTISFLPTPIAEMVVDAEPPVGLRLRALLTGGDKLGRYPRHRPPFRLVNHYGPTENTVVATFVDVTCGPPGEVPPIGRPIANTRAYVLDRHLRPVPVGVKGELYLGGRGLARGYLNDASQTRERFVPDPFDPRPGTKMYRTGDLVRHRTDGNLDFHGRVDRQLKVRGHRIEPGEIEAVLEDHPTVRKSLVVAQESPRGDRSIVAYLVPDKTRTRRGGRAAPEVEAAHSEEWRRIYEGIYRAQPGGADNAFNLVGWNSSYTGQPFTEEEMREQVDGTVERIRALGGRRILEIGCGTGLLLFRLAPGCDRYTATDFSSPVITTLKQECARRGLRNVELLERSADDFGGLDPGAFDVVVLNSVVQYFPGIEYLSKVLSAAVGAVAPTGSVFVGDVRSLPLLRWLHAGVELARAGIHLDGGDVDDLRTRVARRVERERELVIDPRFFAGWAASEPRIGDVKLEVRRGRHHNELTKFRYDALVAVGEAGRPVPAWEERRWEDLGSVGALRTHLERHRPEALRVRSIPDARLARERALMPLLEGGGGSPTAFPHLEVPGAAVRSPPVVEAEDLWALEQDLPYTVRVFWSGSGGDGFHDAWFMAKPTADEPRWARILPDADTRAGPWGPLDSYGNDLLDAAGQELTTQRLREHLQRHLPAYMLPSQLLWMDRLPLTPNGKLNRADPSLLRPPPRPPGSYLAPHGEVEQQVAAIWSDVLGVEQVGADANFFDLGGHSLLLVRVHSRLKQVFATDLSIVDLFLHPTVGSLARAIAEGLGATGETRDRQLSGGAAG